MRWVFAILIAAMTLSGFIAGLERNALAAPIGSTWNGGIGNWNNASNWDTDPLIPNNGGSNTFNVFIDGSKTGTTSDVSLDMTATIDNLTIDTGDNLGINNVRALTLNGGTIANSGSIALNSTGSYTYLKVSGGDVTLNGGGTVTLSYSTRDVIQGVTSSDRLTNVDNTIQGAGRIGQNKMALTNRGTIHANQSNQLTVDVTGTAFDNEGTLRASGSGGLRLNDTTFTNTGTVEAVGSTVTAADTYTQTAGRTTLDGGTLDTGNANFLGGTLTGSGTIDGPANFGINATIGPGFSPGIINFMDDSVFDGLIELELGGMLVDGIFPDIGIINVGTDPATTQFDQINVFGQATLHDSLTIDVSLLGAFDPVVNSFFDVFTADDLLLDLAMLNFIFPTFDDGLRSFEASIFTYGGRESLRLTVEPIPEPSTWLLFAIGVIGVLWYSYRRRFKVKQNQ